MKRSAYASTSSTNEEKRVRIEAKEITSQVEETVSMKTKRYEPLKDGIYWTKVRVLNEKFNERALSLYELVNKVNPIASIHFNFNMEPEFIMKNYPRRCRDTPITLIIGEQHLRALNEACRNFRNVTTAPARLPIPYGTHHTKLSIFESEDAFHVMISTANLITEDWDLKTNGFYYVRAPFRPDEASTSGEKNSFQKDLSEYLESAYKKGPAWKHVEYWVERLTHADFSLVKDRIIASVPGRHFGQAMHLFGHMKLRNLLKDRFSEDRLKKLPLKICQFSSIGSMGAGLKTWLGGQFLQSLSGSKEFAGDVSNYMKLIFPTVENVRTSLEGYMAGGSLMNYKKTAFNQQWLSDYFHQWKSDALGRTNAMPHIKTFTTLESSDGIAKPEWLVITSANLSQAAWGTLEKNSTQLFIRSYELGVLLCDEDHSEDLPLPYDLPLTKYGPNDKPWVTDLSYPKPDVNGNSWIRPG